MKKIKAIIFDFDGLMFDTESIWKQYFFEANAVFNVNFTEQDRIKCMGKREPVIRAELKAENPSLDVDSYRNWMVGKVQQHLAEIGAKKKKGLDEILNYIKKNNISTGIASGSEKNTILQILNNAKVDISLFKSFVTADMEIKSKPLPDMYLKSCENLGVNPEEALVLEDSYSGIRSGNSAGCFTIMIPDTLAPNEEMKKTANLILKDLNEVVEFLKQN